jgi:hypothetical protein
MSNKPPVNPNGTLSDELMDFIWDHAPVLPGSPAHFAFKAEVDDEVARLWRECDASKEEHIPKAPH